MDSLTDIFNRNDRIFLLALIAVLLLEDCDPAKHRRKRLQSIRQEFNSKARPDSNTTHSRHCNRRSP